MTLLSTLGACRADDGQCRDLARHVVEVAEAEGRGSSTVTLENDCKAVRPTKALVDCMMAASTLDAVAAC